MEEEKKKEEFSQLISIDEAQKKLFEEMRLTFRRAYYLNGQLIEHKKQLQQEIDRLGLFIVNNVPKEMRGEKDYFVDTAIDLMKKYLESKGIKVQ